MKNSKMRTKVCKRCNNVYDTPNKYSKICDRCKLPTGYYSKTKMKRK